MPEHKREVKTFAVKYMCDDCKTGEMCYTGTYLRASQNLYHHRCLNCGNEVSFHRKYPEVRTEGQ